MKKTLSFLELKERIIELETENETLANENIELKQAIENVYDNVSGFIDDSETQSEN